MTKHRERLMLFLLLLFGGSKSGHADRPIHLFTWSNFVAIEPLIDNVAAGGSPKRGAMLSLLAQQMEKRELHH